MTTWEQLRDAIRTELKDTNDEPAYKWSDELLYLYLKDALADYSLYLPLQTDRTELTLSEGKYSLPTDFVDVLFVECGDNRFLEERRPRPGRKFPSYAGRPFFYYISGGSLYLIGSPLESDKVYLTYRAAHSAPDDEYDDTHVFTIPANDEELIRLYVRAKCYEQTRSRQSNLDRFKERHQSGSSRQDNPLTPEVENLMEEYYRKLQQRVGGGSITLSRSGRTR